MLLKLHLSHNVKSMQDLGKDWSFKCEVKAECWGCRSQSRANSSHGYDDVDCEYFCGAGAGRKDTETVDDILAQGLKYLQS